MNTNNVDRGALMTLRNMKHRLTQQQYKTLRGQVLAGDPDGAMKGLRNILQRRADRMTRKKNEKDHTTPTP